MGAKSDSITKGEVRTTILRSAETENEVSTNKQAVEVFKNWLQILGKPISMSLLHILFGV